MSVFNDFFGRGLCVGDRVVFITPHVGRHTYRSFETGIISRFTNKMVCIKLDNSETVIGTDEFKQLPQQVIKLECVCSTQQ